MRPSVLDPLFATVTTLPGVGPKIAKTISGLVGGQPDREATLADLLFHIPHGLIDRRHRPGIAFSENGQIVTLQVTVDRHFPGPRGGKAPYKITAFDATGAISFVFFHPRRDWLEKNFPEGEQRIVSGKVEWFNDRPQMVHPDYVLSLEEAANMPAIEPVYPMTAGLAAKTLHRAIAAALQKLPDLPEWQDGAFIERNLWPPFTEALRAIHTPQEQQDLSPEGPNIRRIAYDELLASQLALALVRQTMRQLGGVSRRPDGALQKRVISALPFSLTASQAAAIRDINADLAEPTRMLRLLQGDVGAGKTVVALAALAQVIESGAQGALMAPTEILARQHFASMKPLCDAAGIRLALMTGKDTQKERRLLQEKIDAAEIDLVVGTHALFQGAVTFKDLGLVVVDEQHRFGVHQRLALSAKGRSVDVLVMTATPIPRTLVLTCFGDMDVSRLTEKPAGRKPVTTVSVSLDRLEEIIGRIGAAISNGQKAYWVCPLVEESEKIDLAAVEDRHQVLEQALGQRVSLVHGRMSADEKDAAMAAFKAGETRILVATTVIEVGVDVPDATIIVIEHAERFGLAQLHQLRGRVGRGDKPSSCVLLFKGPLGETATARLNIMRETNDGFLIAEEDLRLRGGGEVLGTRQSGTPGFRIAQVEDHADLMEIARDDARLILETDPELKEKRGDALRCLLYLFGRDEAIRLLRAG
ncbi:ATP-dependent DNA helicase RecG [Roseibium hamelinense]|uniref:ATP-dependent DNA helicase RecG n=1 Tax=Roseibium hamelinense TaxID=150831 RepID=A0A562THG5_9HYPH|nr:ATP-dependent DNA helicase RecG [Roseibium hamelinense]MTI45740.1 ATP-dependent DNA helicase RecG [Roseibium hamelinense]TWI93077.1 ATP-dependent DNA helicase RecG [Roseibium hamelinense]